jgi:hypothetical protein
LCIFPPLVYALFPFPILYVQCLLAILLHCLNPILV